MMARGLVQFMVVGTPKRPRTKLLGLLISYLPVYHSQMINFDFLTMEAFFIISWASSSGFGGA